MDGAVCALGEGFADRGADALGAGRKDHHFAAVLFLELKRLLESIRIGLVHGVLDIGFFNPFAGCVDADLGIALRNLLDGYDDLHAE